MDRAAYDAFLETHRLSMPRPTRIEAETRDAFADRHIGPRDGELAAMLAAVGAGSLDELIDRAVPAAIRTARPAGPAARPHRGRGAGRLARHGRSATAPPPR